MKTISLGIFEGLSPSMGTPAWWHGDSRLTEWDTLDYWVNLGRFADKAGFDFLFFADSFGYPVPDGPDLGLVAEHAIQFPSMDPFVILSAIAHATTSLGLVVTGNTVVERPYAFARRLSTLDRITGGRIGWNIVTGSQQGTVAELFGHGGMIPHDERYEMANEFVDLCMQLWEASWASNAVVRDAHAKTYAQSGKIARVEHDGKFFTSHGYFSVEPTPQRTPYLFQAGASSSGRATAGRIAEATFIQGTTIDATAAVVTDIRDHAERAGRLRSDIKVVSGCTIIVGATEEEAQARHADVIQQYQRDDAALIYKGLTGIDLLKLDPSKPLSQTRSEHGQTMIDRFDEQTTAPLVGEILEAFRRRSIRGFEIVGTPARIARELEEIVHATDIDGIMLEPTFGGMQVYEDFARSVRPLLVERGLVVEHQGTPTLRKRMSGKESTLPSTHPGAQLNQ